MHVSLTLGTDTIIGYALDYSLTINELLQRSVDYMNGR